MANPESMFGLTDFTSVCHSCKSEYLTKLDRVTAVATDPPLA